MELENDPQAETHDERRTASVGRRNVLKAAIVVVPVVATVRSRPAWAAGYASLQEGYGTSSVTTTGG